MKKVILTKDEKVARLRRLLVRAINAHLKKGGKLTAGAFYRGRGTTSVEYCPISCATDNVEGGNYDEVLSKRLKFKLSNKDMWSFIYGFDGFNQHMLSLLTNAPGKNNPFYQLGIELRKRYLP